MMRPILHISNRLGRKKEKLKILPACSQKAPWEKKNKRLKLFEQEGAKLRSGSPPAEY